MNSPDRSADSEMLRGTVDLEMLHGASTPLLQRFASARTPIQQVDGDGGRPEASPKAVDRPPEFDTDTAMAVLAALKRELTQTVMTRARR